MNISNDNDILYNINKLYTKSGYYQKYGADIFTALLIIIFFFIIFFYFTSKNELKKVKYKWNEERCNPKYMPFAGYIMNPQDQSHFDFTMDNFFDCTDGLLNKIGLKHIKPLESLASITDALINTLAVIILSTFNILENLSFNFSFAFGELQEYTAAITNPFITLLSHIDTIFKKFHAFFYTLFYIILGMFHFMYSLVQAAYDNLVKNLILLSIFIIGIFVLFPISIPLLVGVLIPLAILSDKLKMFLDNKEGFKEGKKNKKKGGFFKKVGKKIKKGTEKTVSTLKKGKFSLCDERTKRAIKNAKEANIKWLKPLVSFGDKFCKPRKFW